MKVERTCEACEKKFKCSSFNHRTRCYTCLPKATHKYIKPVKKVEDKK